MKNKPLRHKELNTFKFQPFSERISNINVDVFHRVGHLNEAEESEDKVTVFFKTLLTCNDLNLSKSYENLRKKLGHDIQTLPQLLAQKDNLVSTLCQCLEEADSLSLQPCLELIVALAQDLRQEFYPFYTNFLTRIINLLNTKNTDQLEWSFTCLAYLFKYLWRFLVRDLTTVFEQLVPLLSSSKPHYINNFAAESFAFVARKVKDKRNFLKLILKSVKQNKESIPGCGKLLFEVVNGVQGQFHTCAQLWLHFLLESLVDSGLPSGTLVKVLTYTFTSISNVIHTKHSKILWDTLQEILSNRVSDWKNETSETNATNVCHLLQLIMTVLQHKQCALLADPTELVKTLVDLISNNSWPSPIMVLYGKMSSMILLSPRIRLPQDLSVILIQKVMLMSDWSVLKEFINQMLPYPGFEMHVLPRFLQLCQDKNFDDVLLQLTKVVLKKSPPSKSFNELKNKAIYPLNSDLQWKQKFVGQLMNILQIETKEEIQDKKEMIVCALILIPSVGVNCVSETRKLIYQLVTTIVKEFPLPQMLFLLSQALSAIYLISDVNSTSVDLDFMDLASALMPLIKSHVIALQTLEIYVNIARKEQGEKQINLQRKELLENLASPFHQVRLLSASILLCQEDENPEGEVNKMLSSILAAESITPSVHEYRDKLRHLQLLECSDSTERIANFSIPLNYLLGNLYINFKLLWEPVSKLIVSYAKLIPAAVFWPVFVNQLNIAVLQVEKKIVTEDSLEYKYEILVEASKNVALVEDRPDVSNYRILLWKLMINFPEVCEEKNRDIVTLFLNFLKDEYYRIRADEATSWNIKQGNRKEVETVSNNEEKEDKMDIDDDIEAHSDEEETESPTEDVNHVRSASQNLLAHLGVFGRLRNPRSMFREPELYKAYHDFLSHKNPDVQRAALDCIMTYKFKYLVPYKDHLYGLIDDKTFKEEVTLFRIDTENELIRPEHRAELIPIVMRVVYSKMLNRSGVRTGSKSAKQARRSIVFRFLAGCKQEELIFYLHMAFRLYTPTVQENCAGMVAALQAQLDLSHMVPPKRLLSTARLLAVVLAQVGSLLSPDALRFLLRVLLCVGATVSASLGQRHLVHSGYINILRDIRIASTQVLIKFFTAFETFSWTNEELETVLEVFVWPYLNKLPIEGIHSPTCLLKLFMSWSQVPRYFPLFVSFQKDNTLMTPLPFIMSLLVSGKAHGSVISAIMDMVEKLLTLVESVDEESPPSPPLPHIRCLPVENYTIKGETSLGGRMLYPHIPSILERMQRKLSKPKGSLGGRDLTVLSHVTELVHAPATSDSLLTLLMPLVQRRATAPDHVVCPLLTTLGNLVRNVDQPHRYVRNLSPLFGNVNGAEPRRMLSALVKSIDEKENCLNAQLLEDLNSWNAKWLDQPDFDRRLEAFRNIQQLNKSGELSVEQGVIVIYTCFHFIRVEKDLSLKDCASQCLHYLCPSLCNKYASERDFLINKTILGIIASGIRDKKSDSVQQEAITLLGHMARECADLHPVLQDLSLLGNKSDLEVDFFENLQHLQLHRKVRALLKFCEVSKGLVKPPCTRTLTQFVLPIISHFLCSEKYVNKNTIVDAAIEALGTVCQMLPWHHYELVLRYYLGKLRHCAEFQKQLVRVIVALLNAFHFDLSNADLNESSQTNFELIVMENISRGNTDGEIEEKQNTDGDNENQNNEKETEVQQDTEDLEDVLNIEGPAEGDDDESLDSIRRVEETPILERVSVLSKSVALRVVNTIRLALLPQLHRAVTARTQSEAMHKVNRKMAGPDRDEEDILRVPVALAAVKLLQRLPEQVLEQNIRGMIMKICTFLKSRLDSVRRVTRDTLQKVIVSLGPKYLLLILQEMSSMLTLGFHVHVLVYSIHSVLLAIKPQLQPGDVDCCVPLVLQACKSDLFGKTAEEKEVKQIAGNLMEARANRSYDIFHILAEHASQKCLINLLIPLKEELGHTLSHKAVNKGKECLRHIVLGLVDNKFLTTEALLVFAYGTASESIPALFSDLKKDKSSEKSKQVLLEAKVDTFIIPKEPKSRPSAQIKICGRTNAHIFVEFGLMLYYFLLKREKIKGSDYRPHLDPLVQVLADSLKSEHVKISTLSLQCLCWILKFDLPSLHSNVSDITEWVFKLLHKYAAAGLSKGDNFDLVMVAFKVVATLVRDVKYHSLSKQQQQTLLVYCEQDIHDYSRQAVAFTLLKAILNRKWRLPNLNAVMEKVAKISITSDIEHVRLQARQVFHQYLMEYALGKKFEKHLTWYLQQLEYELQPGRESALEMIKTLISTLPINILKEQSGLVFVTIAARLVNDDVPACRKMSADIIIQLLEKVNNNTHDSLFDIVLLWMQDKKVLHRRLAVQLCGIFATHDKASFESRLEMVLPYIVEQIKLEIQDIKPNVNEEQLNTKEQLRDHHLYQLLHLVVKVSTLCPTILTDQTHTASVRFLTESAQTLLAYPHEWVRLAASQFIGRVLSVLTPTEVAAVANRQEEERDSYLLSNTRHTLRTLILDLCSQLTPGKELNEKLLMQTMKNLIFMAEVLQHVCDIPEENSLSLQWLVRRICKIIHMEIVQAPNFTVLRTICYNWMAALVVKVESETLDIILSLIMAPIVRELNMPEEEASPLKKIAKETANFVKKKIGSDKYNLLLNSLTTKLQVRRAERRKDRAQLAVRDPEKAAKRKITKQLKKKDQKKKKIELAKTGKFKRKAKRKEVSL